ncbi:TPA: hypothetical protein I8190_003552 [Citrobacter freundii]|uniref:DNA-binding protein n=1 Tax=Citrobacter farmeri TaxID=67824 RepID=A0A8H9NRE7_9ENTR|nr:MULTISPECIES: hypothetical protein [Citrobacter]QLN20060.1 hypothetical protein HVZ29_15030 [Escherichia coli]HAT2286577.1 hypothetical protein [Citrobacter freundii]MBJ8671412.1 hypothetical protein [Citrobacter koseri]MBJ8763672.1 hypothetical protein [Citrobacter koseri]MBJ9229080.1 hypothetical protein [Citrobacter koseri]
MWSNEEKIYLKQNYHKFDISHLSTRLGKTPAAIRQKAYVLNLTNKHERRGNEHHLTKYPDEDVKLMKLLRLEGMRVKEIANKFEVTQSMATQLINLRRVAD